MEDLLRDYEAFESLRFEITKMTSEMDEMLDMYDNLTVLQKVANHFSTEAAQIFIKHKFSLEVDTPSTANPTTKTEDAKDPTTGGNPGSDSNKDGKDKAATGKSIWNRLGGLKTKIADAFKFMQKKCRQFWDQAVSYSSKLRLGLKQTANEVANSQENINYQLTGVCEDINNVQLTPVLTQINSAKTPDELAKVMGNVNSMLTGKVIKDTITVTKDDFVSKFIKPHDEANARIQSGTERNASSTAFETAANQASKAPTTDEIKLQERKANANMSASNRIVGFIYQSSNKVMELARKHIKKNG